MNQLFEGVFSNFSRYLNMIKHIDSDPQRLF